MQYHVKLFTPGPGDVDEDVLDAMAEPVLRHYGPEWMEIYNETISLLRDIYQTQNDIYLVQGPGSALLDMAIGSLLSPGEKIIVGQNGFFGERLQIIADGYGLKTIPFTAPLGKALDTNELRKLAAQNPDARAIALVHHETGTTVMNPLQDITEIARQAGMAIIVDAVSSMGGVALPVDEWGIDICVTTPNKCLEAVPGIGIVSISPKAWEMVDAKKDNGHGWYLNLKTWREFAVGWGSWHPSPVTMPTNIVLAMRTSLRNIMHVGLEAHYAKYRYASQAIRKGLGNIGFEMFIPDAYAAPMVTGVKARPEFEVSELLKWLVAERDMAAGGGLGELSGKIFRVGHLGKASRREYLIDFLFSVEEFLRAKGLKVAEGSSLIGI
ncbi:MAG: alanine--glyoxylate aminotransferase family protein [Anaerolineales bacterium]|nr:alanine--glyoxylate aminotransferase family protein [Anaerolineales bacterium]